MVILVIGGAASGKSEFAEKVLQNLKSDKKFYIATMIPYDKECFLKIKKHRNMRSKKGFNTIECYNNICNICIDKNSSILLECVGNLVSNEMFSDLDNIDFEVSESILSGIYKLIGNVENVIIVTNDVFSDGRTYNYNIECYKKNIGKINVELANISDEVFEVVCGIPIQIK